MAFCSTCGTQLNESAKFCGKCGNPAAQTPPSEPVCPACGAKLEAGNRFCANCGTPAVPAEPHTAALLTVQSPQQAAYQPPPADGTASADDAVLFKYTLMNTYFTSRDVNGKIILASEMFKKPTSASVYEVAGAVIGGIAGGLTAMQWGILVQLYATRIRFTRLSPLLKPTDYRIELSGAAIASVTQADAFLDKSITIHLRSGEQYVIEAPKKHRERVVSLLNGMITR